MAGRPSKYNPVYCDEVINTMATGLSLTAFAGDIGVSRDTVNEWTRVHPEFSDAVKIAQAKRVKYLEETMLDGNFGARVTARIFALKNADPTEWKDKREVEHSGNITQSHRLLDARKRAGLITIDLVE